MGVDGRMQGQKKSSASRILLVQREVQHNMRHHQVARGVVWQEHFIEGVKPIHLLGRSLEEAAPGDCQGRMNLHTGLGIRRLRIQAPRL
jgi:hypothetical protein